MQEILYLFHHIHHKNGDHAVHHCGGSHVKIDPEIDYEINHCSCGKHSINKEIAQGHACGQEMEIIKVIVKFMEKCPDGGWHIESGVIINKE